MLLASRQLTSVLGLMTLLMLAGALSAPAGGARAQSSPATPAATPTTSGGVCPAPNSAAVAAAASPDSPLYDYAVLLDVSGSMVGLYNTYEPTKDIFAEVKEALKDYVSDLQPGSMVYIIPFGNEIDPSRVRQFGIDEPSAPDGGKSEALAYIDSIQADNDETRITSSVGYALDLLAGLRDDDREHIQTILLYTDGIGTGPEDLDASGAPDVENLVAALRDFRQEQPYLFVKYVSLGVEVPDAETLKQNGVEVVEQAQGVPPVREVRLAVVPDALGAVEPGVQATNRLCAVSGDLGEGVEVSVNDDPSDLPPDVQVAFRPGGSTLDAAGIPLTYTLASRPASGMGPFTTHVEVRPDDPTVFLVPSRLPVTFSVAPPTPTATLTFGQFPERTVVRDMDTADVTWTLPIDLATETGGDVALHIDRTELDETAPGATVGFRTGDNSLSDEIELDGDLPQAELILSASQEQLAAFPDGEHQIALDVIVTPIETDLTIAGAETNPNGDGALTVSLPAPLVMQPPPTCSVEVGEMRGQTVTAGDASGEPVRWQTFVELNGRDGCQGEVTFDDDALRDAIPGAEATFLDNGQERAELDLGDTRARVDLVVTAPRNAVAALGVGDHSLTVDLIVAPVTSQVVLPEGATENDNGTSTIVVPAPVTVGEQLVATCVLPSFDAQEVTRDGSTEPPLHWAGPLSCDMSDGVSVTLRIAGTDPGMAASFVTEGAEPDQTATLTDGDPMPSLALDVERGAAQNLGAGNREVAALIHISAEPASVALEVEGATRDESGEINARVVAPIRVVEPPPPPTATLTIAPFAPQTVVRGMDSADVAWMGTIDLEAQNGGEAALRVDRTRLDATMPGATVGFRTGDGSLVEEIALTSGQPHAELILSASQETLAALSDGEQQLPVAVIVTPGETDLTIAGAEANRNEDGTATVSLPAPLVMQPPPTCSVEVGEMRGQAVTAGDVSTEPVRWSAIVQVDGSNGCQGEATFDDAALRLAIPGAEATFLVNGEERAELDLGDTRARADLVVTAPRNAVAALDPGEHALAVDLIVNPEGSLLELPEGATENGDGTYTISVPVRVSVREQDVARCTLPVFDAQEVIRDGVTEPPLSWTGPIACEMSGGASVTMRIAETDPGVTARFVTEGAEPESTVTLANGDSMPSLTLEVDRGAAQDLGAGNRKVVAAIHVSADPASALLEVAGASRDESGEVNARVVVPIHVVEPTPTPTPIPDPTAELTLAPFAPQTVVRGMDSADVAWTAAVDFAGEAGAEAVLRIDRSGLDEALSSAALGFRIGDEPPVEEIELDGDLPQVEFVLSASQADLAALSDGEHQIGVKVLVTPVETDLTITGAEATPNGDGSSTVSLSAPLVMQPTPTCSVEVGNFPAKAMTVGEASTEPVRWETFVQLDGSNGCQGKVTFNDDALREMIPEAEATFVYRGEERAELFLADNRIRADLVVTAPRNAVAALEPGEYVSSVDLVVALVRSEIELPEGAAKNDDGTYTLSVPMRVTVSEQDVARCGLPLFDDLEVVRDEAADPALQWTGPITCDLSPGATVTLRITDEDPGLTAQFVPDGGDPTQSVTLAAGDPAPTLAVDVDRQAAQNLGEGDKELAAEILVRAAPDSAVLTVEGETPDENGDVTARVAAPFRVVEPPPPAVIVMDPLELAPDPIPIETRGTSPDPLEWRGELNVERQNDAQGTVAVNEGELPEGVDAFFEVGGMRLPAPVALAGQQGPIELVVQGSLAAAQALGAGEREWEVEVVLDPQGAHVRWPGAAPEGNKYVAKAIADLLVSETPGVRLWTPVFEAQTISSAPQSDAPVKFAAPVEYSMDEGAVGTLSIDDAELQQYGATAELTVNSEPVENPVELNGQPIQLLVTMPRAALTEEKAYDLNIGLVARVENAVIAAIDDAEVEPSAEARLSPVANITYSIPFVRLDLGAWEPEVVDVASTGTGAAPRQWQRAIAASDMEDGAAPIITLDLEDASLDLENTPDHETATIRLYENEVAPENLLDEDLEGRSVTAKFEPGRDRIIAVIEATEDRLRALGLGDNHELTGDLTIDPNGALVELASDSAQFDEPTPQEFAVRTRVYEPFNWMRVVLGGGGGLLALLAVLALIYFRPGLPAGAGIESGGGPQPLPSGGGWIGPGGVVNAIPTGEMKAKWRGRSTGNATFVPEELVEVDGERYEPGKRVPIVVDDTVESVATGNEWTYVVDDTDADGGDGGDGDGDGY